MIGVHEIGVQSVRADIDTVEQRMRPLRVERVPAHMRDLQGRIRRRDPVDLARDPAQSRDHLVFAAALGHELHANANPQERAGTRAHAVIERLDHAADGIETAPAIGEGADAGQHHTVGPPDLFRVRRHHDRLVQSFLTRGAFERLGRRVQIARAVIDDRHAHRDAPGCGNKPRTSDESCGRRAVAMPGENDLRDPPPAADGLAADEPVRILSPKAQKTRRSADSRSSPTTTPTLLQRRRDSVNRRNVAASKPTSNASRKLTVMITPGEAPISRNPTWSATATMTYPTNTSHSRCRSIHNGASRNAQNEKPSRTNTKRSGSGVDSPAFSGGSCTV